MKTHDASDIRRHYAQGWLRKIIAMPLVDWINAPHEEIKPHEWMTIITKMDPIERNRLDAAQAQMPALNDYLRFVDLLKTLSLSNFPLTAEDRGHLAIARSELLDAGIAVLEVDFDRAVRHAEAALTKLDWLVHHRNERISERRMRLRDPLLFEMLDAMATALGELCERLRRARSAAA